ncbi:hypothetical protein O3G_MSEX001887 [Manduca sexta]|uniref:MADF domain-containing protein n=2 Tax=Manduca sexta TaxID=7130 RepID=A0A921YM09_MANSE|nr:hypothetical protein O3G_MSEX001887 [Manduca sexta]
MLLVKTIEKFPCLYNSSLHEYLKKDITDKAWSEVANHTQLSVGECKEKWKNLRYGLLRSLRPHPDGTIKKRYYLHDEMEFVIPYIKPSTRHGNLITVPFEEDDEENNSNGPEIEEATLAQQYFEFECVTEPQKKRSRKSESFKPVLPPKTLNDECHENSRKMFLLSLLPEVEVLTEGQMRFFRRKVLELLDDCRENPNTYDISILNNWQTKRPSTQNEAMKSEPL